MCKCMERSQHRSFSLCMCLLPFHPGTMTEDMWSCGKNNNENSATFCMTCMKYDCIGMHTILMLVLVFTLFEVYPTAPYPQDSLKLWMFYIFIWIAINPKCNWAYGPHYCTALRSNAFEKLSRSKRASTFDQKNQSVEAWTLSNVLYGCDLWSSLSSAHLYSIGNSVHFQLFLII